MTSRRADVNSNLYFLPPAVMDILASSDDNVEWRKIEQLVICLIISKSDHCVAQKLAVFIEILGKRILKWNFNLIFFQLLENLLILNGDMKILLNPRR